MVVMLQVLFVPQWGWGDETPPMSHSRDETPRCVLLGCGVFFWGGGGSEAAINTIASPPKNQRVPPENSGDGTGSPMGLPGVSLGCFMGEMGGGGVALTTITPPPQTAETEGTPPQNGGCAVGSPMSHNGAEGMRPLGVGLG